MIPDSPPLAVKWLRALAWLRIGAYLGLVIFAISMTSGFESPNATAFRRGAISAWGLNPDNFGPGEAGQVAGKGFVPASLSALILYFLSRRRFTALRRSALVQLLFSAAQPSTFIFSLPMRVLALCKSTENYCSGASGSSSAA